MSRTDQESYWKERVESWKSSGLTRKEYCEKEGIDLTKKRQTLTPPLYSQQSILLYFLY